MNVDALTPVCPRGKDVVSECRGRLPRLPARGGWCSGARVAASTDVNMAINGRSIGVNSGVGVGSHTDPVVGWGCCRSGATRMPARSTDVNMAINGRSIGVNSGVGVGSHTDPVGWGCCRIGVR